MQCFSHFGGVLEPAYTDLWKLIVTFSGIWQHHTDITLVAWNWPETYNCYKSGPFFFFQRTHWGLLVLFFLFFFLMVNGCAFLKIYLFMAVLGLRFCARAFSSCGKWGPLFIAMRGPLTIAASLVVEHRLQTRRLSNCGSRAQLLSGTWDLPRPGLEPVSPALAGRFSTTAPPGKPLLFFNTFKNWSIGGFPGGTVVKNLPANAGDMGSVPGLGRSHVPWSN